MRKFLAKADKETSSTEKKYSLFIGRWQFWHEGHDWLIRERLREGKNILIAIRDVRPDAQNPWSAKNIKNSLDKVLREFVKNGRIKIIIIPDIESINYGRNVGYDVIEHRPPDHIHKISSTKIRKKLQNKTLK